MKEKKEDKGAKKENKRHEARDRETVKVRTER